MIITRWVTIEFHVPAIVRRSAVPGTSRASSALATLATQFGLLSKRGLLRAEDPLLAAHHFVGLLLWIPINRAMFTGDETSNARELHAYAGAATEAFLRAYGSHEAEQIR